MRGDQQDSVYMLKRSGKADTPTRLANCTEVT